jgi:shikimate kinase
MNRILLVGFMASGKSTVGRILADRLGWDFLDFDEEIERRQGEPVREIFRRLGEPGFRRLEAELTAEVGFRDGIVLAPGGGWITRPELLQQLAGDSAVVWLRISPGEAARRAAAEPGKRPLLAGPDPAGLAAAMMREREPLYRLADYTVDVDDLEPGTVADLILERFRSELRAAPPADGGNRKDA